MKSLLSSVLIWVITLQTVPNASTSIGPTFSGGEIHKLYSHDMAGTTGIYEYGFNLSFEKKYAEANFQTELGWYNRSPSYGVGLDINGKMGFIKDMVKLYGGFGFAYNGYVYDRWRGHNSFVGEFTHTYSPYLSTKVELFQRVRIGFEGLFKSNIFWKARIGLSLFHFK